MGGVNLTKYAGVVNEPGLNGALSEAAITSYEFSLFYAALACFLSPTLLHMAEVIRRSGSHRKHKAAAQYHSDGM
jgi:hypothetical protein